MIVLILPHNVKKYMDKILWSSKDVRNVKQKIPRKQEAAGTQTILAHWIGELNGISLNLSVGQILTKKGQALNLWSEIFITTHDVR